VFQSLEAQIPLLLHRLVIDVELDPQGRLQPRPGAAWRPEPARGEKAIHRRLARLAEAPDARIAAFASVYGLLRRGGSAVMGPPGPGSSAATAAGGQEAVDDSARVLAWVDRGMVGPPPQGTQDTIATIAMYASMPDGILDASEAFIDGSAVPRRRPRPLSSPSRCPSWLPRGPPSARLSRTPSYSELSTRPGFDGHSASTSG
jgi:hypothetical protein